MADKVTDAMPVAEQVKMLLMGADYTGLAPKTHAWVELALLRRVYDALSMCGGHVAARY